MKATHIFETVIYASDLAAAERFYSEVLGLEVISRFGVALAFRCEGGVLLIFCLLYTSDAADERSSVDLGGRRIIKKKKQIKNK